VRFLTEISIFDKKSFDFWQKKFRFFTNLVNAIVCREDQVIRRRNTGKTRRSSDDENPVQDVSGNYSDRDKMRPSKSRKSARQRQDNIYDNIKNESSSSTENSTSSENSDSEPLSDDNG